MTAGTDARPAAGVAAGAEELRELAAGHAAEADGSGALAPEVVGAVRSHGFARHFVPAAWGGTEGTFGELAGAVLTIARSCPSTAWIASLTAHSARFAAHLPQEGQREIWGGGPDTVVAAGLPPTGRAVAVDGGWRLSGSWGYVSGVEHADWVLLCAAAPAPGAPAGSPPAGGPPAMRFFAVRARDCAVHPTWDSIGMRATGSHTVVVEDVLVPGHLSFDRMEMLSGRNAHSTAAVHNVPLPAAAGLAFAVPAAGAAAGALDAFAATLTGRRRTQTAETRLVRASGRIDAARLLIERNAATADGGAFTRELLAHSERNAATAAELLTEAVDLLVHGAGTSGLAPAQPLQRFWRDVTVAASHVALQYDTSARGSYATALLGPVRQG
ncbi:hydrolase [Streptomyces sp. S1A]|uniref:acyl-CoA dehydrogenase family protein n=1 Tax=Streptomyces sp. ICN903 TaxID=2964654 RepID=UPI001EDB26ED|nr:acyl-CoA dehydrogenase family protein [Streptomyces sp. ICN903]MCG3039328.1 hydrolase [Streptomyces sp. ICN903]